MIFNFAVDIIYHFIFELEVASSDPMARCGHGQNRMRTSGPEVETVRQYHGNVGVHLGVFYNCKHMQTIVHIGRFAATFALTPFWRSYATMGASYPMIVI